MAPKQKTFELIPDPIGFPGPGQQAAAVANKPPMTTKQAKRLYRQKNKGPKISKAEQRRIELMEQDRIRKEFEKEKAQARARTARERKKEKEEKEKEARRRKGLPLIDVHPSQDTLSKFINRLGGARKSGSSEGKPNLETVQETETETVTGAESDTDTDGGDVHRLADEEAASEKENLEPNDELGDRPAKRRRLTQPNLKLLDRMIHIPSQRLVIGAVARVAQEVGVESRSRASSVDTDDPATETMLEDQIIADVELASSKSMTNSSPIRERHAKDAASMTVPAQEPICTAPITSHQIRSSPPKPPSGQQEPQPSIPAFQNKPQEPKSAVPGHVRGHHGGGIFKKPGSPFAPHHPQERLGLKFSTTGVPSAPPNFRVPAAPQSSTFVRPKFLPRRVQATNPLPVQASPTYAGSRRLDVEAANAFPTSTQLLVLNHADELFPSASQEAEELFEYQHPVPKAGAKASSNVPIAPAVGVSLPNQHCKQQSLHKKAMAKLTPTKTMSDTKIAKDRAQDRIVTPQKSPPKKRMFGSSGPGAEVLIAMERSYKQSLQEQRRREEELRALERDRRREAEQLARELADMIDHDELSDGLLGEVTQTRQPTHTGVAAAEGLDRISSERPPETTEVTASQETDYGDFDFSAEDELGVLADMAWMDDDLDGF
ncbi:hypothetical protein SLS53_008348 [Cytospora paraplurivora]|uniref:Uncharacterized protein n=1 Tax=Cytospora paraplurivora TaxID=2898453 RepID=A0AAN9U0Y5_9PEZI